MEPQVHTCFRVLKPRPAQSSPNFLSLPTELFTLITNYLSAFDIMNFILSGSEMLNLKLIPAIQRFDMTLPIPGNFKLPEIIYKFQNLKELILVAYECTYRSTIWILDFGRLPKGLEKLVLRFGDDLMQLTQYIKDQIKLTEKSHLSKIKHLSIGSSQTSTCEALASNFFSSLESLVCSPSAFNEDFFVSYASHLKFLEFKFESRNNYQRKHQFPRNLLSLKNIGGRETLESTLLLPHTLTQLSFNSSNITLPNLMVNLPSTLTFLSFESCYWAEESVSALPTGLLHLHIGSCVHPTDWNGTMIKNLPQNLLTFVLSQKSTRNKLPAECLRFLPPKLERLELGTELVNPEEENDLCLDSIIEKLPRSLKYLHLHNTSVITDQAIPRLPPNLTSLELPSAFRLSSKAIGNLPKNLTHLNLRHNQVIEDYAIKMLPSCLLYLDMAWANKLSDLGMLSLPSNITHLELRSIKYLQPRTISHLPRGLETLLLHSCQGLTDDAVADLPRCLTTLDLSGCDLFTDKSCASFPRNLKTLLIPSATKITNSGLRDLPRNLLHLDLSWNKKITSKGLINLPRHLLSFCVASAHSLENQPDLPKTCLIHSCSIF